jgi:hypothetical protein
MRKKKKRHEWQDEEALGCSMMESRRLMRATGKQREWNENKEQSEGQGEVIAANDKPLQVSRDALSHVCCRWQ